MAYDTNNPLGSKDPRDLYDNATNLDLYVNGEQPMYPNRFGALKLSMEGMNQQFEAAQDGRQATFQAFLDQSNYAFIGDYIAGLVFTTRSQYFVRNGVMYVPENDLTLPYTTTGVWATEETLFKVLADDATLRQELLATDGSNRVGHNPSGTYDAGTVGAQLKTYATDITTVNTRVTKFLQYANNETEETAAFADGAVFVVRLDLLEEGPPPEPTYVLDQEYIPSGGVLATASGIRQSGSGQYQEAGFSFTAGVTGPLARINAFIYLSAGTPNDIIAELKPDVSGSPGSSVLAAVTIPAFSSPNSLTGLLSVPRVIDFAGVSQVSGTVYWLTFRPAVTSGTGFYGLGTSTQSGFVVNSKTRTSTSGAWTTTTGSQAAYRTYTQG